MMIAEEFDRMTGQQRFWHCGCVDLQYWRIRQCLNSKDRKARSDRSSESRKRSTVGVPVAGRTRKEKESSMNAQHQALGALLGIGLAAGVVGIDIAYAQSKANASDVRVTVIGCIKRSQPRVPETVGTTIIPAGETKYVLSNITLVPEKGRTETA